MGIAYATFHQPPAMQTSFEDRRRTRMEQWREEADTSLVRLRRVRPATIRFTDPGVSDFEAWLASEVVVRVAVRAAPASPAESGAKDPGSSLRLPSSLGSPSRSDPAASNDRPPNVEVLLTVLSRHEASVGTLISSVRSDALPDPLKARKLRLLHSGRLLADRGVLLVDWLDTLDARRASALAGTAADDFGFDSRHLPPWERTVTLAAAAPPPPPPSSTYSHALHDEDQLAAAALPPPPPPPGAGDSLTLAGLRIPLAPLFHAVRPSVLAQHSAAPALGRTEAGASTAVLRLPLQLPPDPAVLADIDAARAALTQLVPAGMRAAWTGAAPHLLLPLHSTPGEVLFDMGRRSVSDDDEEGTGASTPLAPRDKGKARATDLEVTALANPNDESDTDSSSSGKTPMLLPSRTISSVASERVYLQCAVGTDDEVAGEDLGHTPPLPAAAAEQVAAAGTASGLDQLVASGALSAEEVERIRRVFLYSRPELLRGRTGDVLQAEDEEAHIRALEDQWLSNAAPMGGTEAANQPPPQAAGQGSARQAWVGMMIGFFFPSVALFFIADRPHPSFFPTLSAHPRVVESESESDTDDDGDEDEEDEVEEEQIDVEAEMPAGAQQPTPPTPVPFPRPPSEVRGSESPWEDVDSSNPARTRVALDQQLEGEADDEEPLADLAARVSQRRSQPQRPLRRREGSRAQRRARPAPLISLEWGDALRDALARGLRARRRAARWEARVARERARRLAIEVRRRVRGGALVSPSVRSGIFVGIATNLFFAIFRYAFSPP